MTRPVDIATNLMRMALALVDMADESVAAARLQHAIDSVGEGAGRPASGMEWVDGVFATRP